jgi:hypothetical protein
MLTPFQWSDLTRTQHRPHLPGINGEDGIP